MLNEKGIKYTKRDYLKQPLSAAEIKGVLKKAGLGPKDVLRTRDPAFKELGLTGEESDAVLIGHMAEHPGLLNRPFGVKGGKAVFGRPIENLLALA